MIEANRDWLAVVEWLEPGLSGIKSLWRTIWRYWDSSARNTPKLRDVISSETINMFSAEVTRDLTPVYRVCWKLVAAVSSNCDGRCAVFLTTSQIKTQHMTASSVRSTKSVAVECEYSLLLTQRYFQTPRDLTFYFVKSFCKLSCIHVYDLQDGTCVRTSLNSYLAQESYGMKVYIKLNIQLVSFWILCLLYSQFTQCILKRNLMYSRTRKQWHWFIRHLVCFVSYSVVPINPSLLTIILYTSVRTTPVYNDTEYSVPFMTL